MFTEEDVGVTVISKLYGKGVIVKIGSAYNPYPVIVKFDNDIYIGFSPEGFYVNFSEDPGKDIKRFEFGEQQ